MSARGRTKRRAGYTTKAISRQILPADHRGTGQVARPYAVAEVINGLTTGGDRADNMPWGMVNALMRDPRNETAFGPLQPLDPQAIDPVNPRTGRPEPRVWEYPFGWNIPGNEHREIPWEVLRAASTGVDIIRRCIEVRKKHVRSIKWTFTVTADAVAKAQQAAPGEARSQVLAKLRDQWQPEIERLKAFWTKPWKSNGLTFAQWMNNMLENHLVYDGVVVYPRTTYGGQLIGFEIIDPRTIKPLLDYRGARPEPPFPAFQQIMYGFPRGEFTATVEQDSAGVLSIPGAFVSDQLFYYRENVRSDSPYGLSAVEQALAAGRLYLKREGWMLAEYNDGSTPLVWLQPDTPQDGLNLTQRREWENALNDELAGQTAARHRIKIGVPGHVPTLLPEVAERYKPDYDLFLIKRLASFFGVPISELGFTEVRGLGSSGMHEQQSQVSQDVGEDPDIALIGTIVNELSSAWLDMPADLEWTPADPDDENAPDADAVADAQVKRASMTVNDDRRRVGMPTFDIPEADMPFVLTMSGPVYLEGTYQAQQDQQQMALMPPPMPGGGGALGDGTGVPKENAPKARQARTGNGGQMGNGGAAHPRGPHGEFTGSQTSFKHAGPDPSVADAVYEQLSTDYPPEALTWVKSAHWRGPVRVPMAKIDMQDRDSWRASHEPAKVKRFAKQIGTGKVKPVILVDEPGDESLLVADGHHRTLAADGLGKPVLAYIATVGTHDGPWVEMHSSQRAQNDAPVSAPPATGTAATTAKSAEVRAFRRWSARGVTSRAFEWLHHSPDEVAEIMKAGGADPKVQAPPPGQPVAPAPDHRWPAWAFDAAVATAAGAAILIAMRKLIRGPRIARLIARLTDRPADIPLPSVPGIRAMLDVSDDGISWATAIAETLAGTLGAFLAQAWLLGDRSGAAALAALDAAEGGLRDGAAGSIDWSGWTPGDSAAALKALAVDGLLAEYNDYISVRDAAGIAATRLDRIAELLAAGLGRGDSVAAIAASLAEVLTDPTWAMTVAWTETIGAQSAAAVAAYVAAGVGGKAWFTARDQRVCPVCKLNEDAGVVAGESTFPSGAMYPPAHPRCRCAVLPAALPARL